MNIPIRLETAAGELVSDEECILPFIYGLPQVVVWGERFFMGQNLPPKEEICVGMPKPVYREAFTYYITGMEKQLAAHSTGTG